MTIVTISFKTFISDNVDSVENPQVFWGALLWEKTFSFISHLNQTKVGKINTLENDMQKLEQALQRDRATEDRKKSGLKQLTAGKGWIWDHRTRRNFKIILVAL